MLPRMRRQLSPVDVPAMDATLQPKQQSQPSHLRTGGNGPQMEPESCQALRKAVPDCLYWACHPSPRFTAVATLLNTTTRRASVACIHCPLVHEGS